MASNGNTSPVLIIGSGPTGLTLAQGLKKAGIDVVVFEKYTKDQVAAYSRDWNMGLHWGHDSLEALLPPDLVARLKSTQTDPLLVPTENDFLPMLNGEDGSLLAKIPTGKFIRYTRSKFLNLLKTGLDVRYGKELSDIRFEGSDGPVTALFNDGTSATGKILVGADGVRSAVRKYLLGEKAEPRRLPYTAVWTQKSGFSREEALKMRSWSPLHMAGIHPNGMFSFHGMQDVEDPNKPEDWKFFFYISWPTSFEWQDSTENWTNDQWREEALKHSEQFCEPWIKDFRSLNSEHPLWHIYMSDWDPSAEGCQWDNHGGRITLAGDACHSITFQRGQGLNHSLADAANLCREIKLSLTSTPGSTLSESIARYEEEMITRTGNEVRMCTENTHMLHDWSKAQQSPVFRRGTARAHEEEAEHRQWLRKIFLEPAHMQQASQVVH